MSELLASAVLVEDTDVPEELSKLAEFLSYPCQDQAWKTHRHTAAASSDRISASVQDLIGWHRQTAGAQLGHIYVPYLRAGLPPSSSPRRVECLITRRPLLLPLAPRSLPEPGEVTMVPAWLTEIPARLLGSGAGASPLPDRLSDDPPVHQRACRVTATATQDHGGAVAVPGHAAGDSHGKMPTAIVPVFGARAGPDLWPSPFRGVGHGREDTSLATPWGRTADH